MKSLRTFGIATGLISALYVNPINAEIVVSDPFLVISDGPHAGEVYGWQARSKIDGSKRDFPHISGPKVLYHRAGAFVFPQKEVPNISSEFYGFGKYEYDITVPRGHTLERLAFELSYLTDEEVAWQSLYEENKDVIGNNPNLILPGMLLKHTAGNYFMRMSGQ